MKSLLALGALLLSAAPALADDFLYVSCVINGTSERTALPSGTVIEEGSLPLDYLLFKVNLTSKKLRTHTNTGWTDIRIEGNQIIQDIKVDLKDFSSQLRVVMPLNPPGRYISNLRLNTKTEYQVIKGEGECSEIDSSVFDEASKQ